MAEIEYPSNTNQWARDKGVKRPCSACRRDYDPNLLDPEYGECRECHSKRLIREEKKHKRKEMWDRVIWPKD